MTTNQILQLDCRIQSNADIIENVLRKIKPLAKSPEGQQVPLEKLEIYDRLLTGMEVGRMTEKEWKKGVVSEDGISVQFDPDRVREEIK